jgi:hypothetical protein
MYPGCLLTMSDWNHHSYLCKNSCLMSIDIDYHLLFYQSQLQHTHQHSYSTDGLIDGYSVHGTTFKEDSPTTICNNIYPKNRCGRCWSITKLDRNIAHKVSRTYRLISVENYTIITIVIHTIIIQTTISVGCWEKTFNKYLDENKYFLSDLLKLSARVEDVDVTICCVLIAADCIVVISGGVLDTKMIVNKHDHQKLFKL